MITGAHVIIYSTDAEADRRFFAEVLKYPSVDAGDGWLIFALPPAELGIHPSEENNLHQFYFMCDDINALIADMSAAGTAFTEPEDQGWGILSTMALPGGGRIGVYQPRHPIAAGMTK